MKRVLVVLVVLLAAIVPSAALGGNDPQPYNDPKMTARLEKVGSTVEEGVRVLYPTWYKGKQWAGHLSFSVVDDAELNAGAYPDGRIIVTKGMMQAVKSDAELTGVLNHEAVHAAQRQGTDQVKKSIVTRGLAFLAARALGVKNDTAALAAGVVGGIFDGHHSRVDENAADLYSVDLCHAEGIDPYAPSRVMKTLQGKYGNGDAGKPVLGWFASHGDTGARIARMEAQAKKYAAVPTATGVAAVTPCDSREVTIGTTGEIARPKLRGAVTISIRTGNCGGSGWGWGGCTSEQVLRTEIEDSLLAQGFTLAAWGERNDDWSEQDQASTGRFNKKTLPRKGQTVGARWKVIVNLNYTQVTEQRNFDLNRWTGKLNGRVDYRERVAEIKGVVDLESMETSTIVFTTKEYHGKEKSSEVDLEVRRCGGDIRVYRQKTPEGRAVAQASISAAAALADFVDERHAEDLGTDAQDRVTYESGEGAMAKYTLHITDSRGCSKTIVIREPYGSPDVSDYILLYAAGAEPVSRIAIDRVRGYEIWGAMTYPLISQLDLRSVTQARLMKSDR